MKCHICCAYLITLACVASLGFGGVAIHLNNNYGMCGHLITIVAYSIYFD